MTPRMQLARDVVETTVGVMTATTPLWIKILTEINLILSTVAAVGGAIIAVHGVWRIFRVHHRKD